MNIGRPKFKLERLWTYLKYVQAGINLLTLGIVSSLPWWQFGLLALLLVPLTVVISIVDTRKIYKEEAEASFKPMADYLIPRIVHALEEKWTRSISTSTSR